MTQVTNISQMSAIARRAAQAGDWATVGTIARKIARQEKKNPEGFFLTGLAEKALRRTNKAETAFRKAISLDARRYDAAIELANQ